MISYRSQSPIAPVAASALSCNSSACSRPTCTSTMVGQKLYVVLTSPIISLYLYKKKIDKKINKLMNLQTQIQESKTNMLY